ncbi:MAG: hypothetical protein Q9217_000119 [Psora testacea]
MGLPATIKTMGDVFNELTEPNDFKISTWMAMGAALLLLSQAYLPIGLGSWIPLLYLGYRMLKMVVDTLRLHTGSFTNMKVGRWTARLPDSETPLVMFILGARINHPLGKLSPGAADIDAVFQEMWREAETNRDKWGYLGKTATLVDYSDSERTPTIWLSYWKDLKGLQKFSASAAHRLGQNNYNAKKYPYMGIMHETFYSPKGCWETIYDEFPPWGLVLRGFYTLSGDIRSLGFSESENSSRQAASRRDFFNDAQSQFAEMCCKAEFLRITQARLPDILYCVAGGCSTEMGFLTDIDAGQVERCMRNNYLTAAFAAQSMLKLWTEDDKNAKASGDRLRQIVFIASAAAFVGLPGYTAYTPSKCAVRALADTLRMEALQHSGPQSTYTVHCAFPSNFITESFLQEQESKPVLTKQLEGTMGTLEELRKRFPSAGEVAQGIIAGVERGDFAICNDSTEAALLFTNMIGPSPKRGLGIYDSLSATVMGIIVWPVLRRHWDRVCKRDGKRSRARNNVPNAPR